MQVVSYSVLRLVLLVAFGGFAYALGMRGLLLLVVAFLGSGIVSVFALRQSRARAGEQVRGSFRKINERIDAASRAEDDQEAPRREPAAPGPEPDSGPKVTPPSTSADPRTEDSPRNS